MASSSIAAAAAAAAFRRVSSSSSSLLNNNLLLLKNIKSSFLLHHPIVRCAYYSSSVNIPISSASLPYNINDFYDNAKINWAEVREELKKFRTSEISPPTVSQTLKPLPAPKEPSNVLLSRARNVLLCGARKLEVVEKDTAVCVSIFLPGLHKDDVTVTLEEEEEEEEEERNTTMLLVIQRKLERRSLPSKMSSKSIINKDNLHWFNSCFILPAMNNKSYYKMDQVWAEMNSCVLSVFFPKVIMKEEEEEEKTNKKMQDDFQNAAAAAADDDDDQMPIFPEEFESSGIWINQQSGVLSPSNIQNLDHLNLILRPPMDLSVKTVLFRACSEEDEDAVNVKIFVPRIRKDDVNVSVKKMQHFTFLDIKHNQRDQDDDCDDDDDDDDDDDLKIKFHSSCFILPKKSPYKMNQVRADMNNGMLRVFLPRMKEKKIKSQVFQIKVE
ncbi:Alpha crystallin/Hsp20 domain [Macleaya cordata]|uniref:Alpha crystallin/Hsp20 domain n=1 Tax=Macleaya cordata TaxID=56857 RepID=A0A200RCG7_MACCD|nr:Alpha crystallin/Hsp20 domain [Macleaya cordata]